MSPFHQTPADAVPVPAHCHPARSRTRPAARSRVYPCPRCAAFTLRRSRIGSFTDFLLAPLLVAPYRCRRCFHRFHRWRPAMWFVSRR